MAKKVRNAPGRTLLPAKLTRPSASGLSDRPRLFAQLDLACQGRAIWIFAPGGAGKTSLVSSWIHARKMQSLWYQLDAGDNDPAGFFHYLGLAAPSLGAPGDAQSAMPLPHLTPEYLLGLGVFVRRFFEALTVHVVSPTVLVFDNYQEVGPDAALHAIAHAAIDALPANVCVVFSSRTPPPAAMARRLAEPSFVVLNWDALKLDDDEAREIAHARGLADGASLDRILPLARGWAAGLTLLVRAWSRGLIPATDSKVLDQSIVDYFGGEVFDALPLAQQAMLATTALAPRISTGLANVLCDSGSAVFLPDMHANRLFVDCRVEGAGEKVYEYHPLFRDFLIVRGEKLLSLDKRQSAQKAIARFLEADKHIEEAIALWTAARDWSEVTRMVVEHAPAFMEQGRSQTVEGWTANVPDEVIDCTAWLLYWRGIARSLTDPASGRSSLHTAYDRFVHDGEDVGALLTCAGILNISYFEQGDYSDAAQWADRAEVLYGACEGSLPALTEATLITCLAGPTDMCLDHPLWNRGADRAHVLATTSRDPRVILRVAPYAILFHIIRGDLDRAHTYLRLLDGYLDHKGSPPIVRLVYEINANVLAWQEARHADAYLHTDRGLAIAKLSGVHVLDGGLHTQTAYAALSEGDAERAEQALAKAAPLIPPTRASEMMHLQSMRAMVLMLRGDRRAAIPLLREAVERLHARAAKFGESTTSIQLGQALMLAGQHGEARERLGRALDLARAMRSDILTFQGLMALAWSWLDAGDEERGLEHLRAGLTIGARHNYLNCHPLWLPKVMAHLFATALEANIEADYVRRFITHRKVMPDSPEVASWPWPIRVYTLERFRVLLGEQPLKAGRKAPRRVLELLQAIVALGPRAASRERLTKALWPEAEGVAARDAFEIALHRLRKLLGEEAVILEHGQVSLAPEIVWIDAQAFERLAEQLQRGPGDGDASEAAFTRTVNKALTLYAGHFLANAPEQPWMLPARARLRSRLERLVAYAGAHWEQTRDLARAIALYQRAIEVDPLAEGFYRRLMACHARSGQRAEALEVYRRCRHMLSVVLGVSPSAETDALRASLTS